MASAPPARAAGDPVYTIENVQVDVTASDAATARDLAFVQAQQAAFRQLATQLVGADNVTKLKMPDDTTLATMVKDYETTNEQLSSVRYIGTYTVRFRGPAVRGYLAHQGMNANMAAAAQATAQGNPAAPVPGGGGTPPAPGKPVLILPFYQQDTEIALWNDDNPWLSAWQKVAPAAGGTAILAPLGDASDMSDLDGTALTYDRTALTRMAQRYGAGDVAMAVAAPSDRGTPPGSVTVTLYRTDRDDPQPVRKITVAAQPGESDSALYARVADQTRAALQQDWKHAAASHSDTDTDQDDANAGAPLAHHGDAFAGLPAHADSDNGSGAGKDDSASSGHYRAEAHFHGLSEWLRLQRALRSTDGVTALHVGTLSPGQADVDFSYRGTPDALRISLTEAGVALAPGDGGTYDLHLASSAD